MLELTIKLMITSALLFGSPGPATIALAASGASFGIRRSIRFLAGIIVGLLTVLLLCLLGLSQLLATYPDLQLTLMSLGSVYLLYLAYLMLSVSQH